MGQMLRNIKYSKIEPNINMENFEKISLAINHHIIFFVLFEL